jgi:hypothetical protein
MGLWCQLDPSHPAYEGVEFSGVYIFADADLTGSWAVGQRVDIVGEAGEYFGMRQLTSPTFTLSGTGADAVPTTLDLAAVAQAIADGSNSGYEGLLVEVEDVTVRQTDPPRAPADTTPGEVAVDRGLRIGDEIWAPTPSYQTRERLSRVAGVFGWQFSRLHVFPRGPSDVSFETPELLALVPGEAFLRVDGTRNITEVRLEWPAREDLTVSISAPSSLEGAPTSITVPAGNASWALNVTAGPTAGPVSALVAGLPSGALSMDVTVLPAGAPSDVRAVSPPKLAIEQSGQRTVMVALTVPPTVPTELTVGGGGTEIVPFGGPAISFSTSSVFGEQTLVTSCPACVGSTGTLSYSVAGVSVDQNYLVVPSVGISAAPKINEIDPEGVSGRGGDTEFIEIVNAGQQAVDLSSYTLHIVDNAGVISAAVPLTGTLEGGAYLVVGGLDVVPPNGALFVELPSGSDRLADASGGAVLEDGTTVHDTALYGAVTRTVDVNPFGTVSLDQGVPLDGPYDTSERPASIARWLDGFDANDDLADWGVSYNPTPGEANDLHP